MNANITNITLNRDRFVVYATIYGNDEVEVFAAEATARDVKAWLSTCVEYHVNLLQKLADLKTQLGVQ